MAERLQQLLEIGFKYLGHIKYFQFHFPGTTRRFKIVKRRILFLSCDIWHEHHIGSKRESVSGFSEKYKSVSFGTMGGFVVFFFSDFLENKYKLAPVLLFLYCIE